MRDRKHLLCLTVDERLIVQLRKKGVGNLSALVEVFFEEFLRRYEPKEDRILRRNEIRQVFQELFGQHSSTQELLGKFLEFLKQQSAQPEPKSQAISEPKQESKAQQKEPAPPQPEPKAKKEPTPKAKDPNALFGGRDRFEVMEEWMRELARQYGNEPA